MTTLAAEVSIFFWILNCHSIICTDRPIIGVLIQEFMQPNQTYFGDENVTGFILASYVKAIESSGARVVPIFNQRNDSYYEWIMKSINGILLPGGLADLQPEDRYYDTSKKVLKIAEKFHHKGIFFPVFGVCLGFQAMLTIFNNDTDLLMQCDSIFESYPLEFQSNYTESLLFTKIDRGIIDNLKSFPITFNNHRDCVLLNDYKKSNLSKEWRVTSFSTTSKGVKFIASIEHEKYPFVGVQFHPEMVAFNWREHNTIPHDQRTIQTNRFSYDVFVDISRSNDNKFEILDEERNSLIYNYNPTYFFDKIHNCYSQRYIFHE